jgi:Leucine-rich repeat (LRR) protein
VLNSVDDIEKEDFLQNLSDKLNKPIQEISDLDIDNEADVTSGSKWWVPIDFSDINILSQYGELNIHSDDVNLSDFPENNSIKLLYIRETKDNNLIGIEKFKGLRKIVFYSGYVAVNDISALENCPQLESIDFRFTYDIKDYSVLGSLKNLKELRFFTSDMTGIESISYCENLEILTFQNGCQLPDYDFLQPLTKLKYLKLCGLMTGKKAELNIELLSNLSCLEYLEFSHLELTESEIKILSEMNKLECLTINGLRHPEDSEKMLSGMLLNCEIICY